MVNLCFAAFNYVKYEFLICLTPYPVYWILSICACVYTFGTHLHGGIMHWEPMLDHCVASLAYCSPECFVARSFHRPMMAACWGRGSANQALAGRVNLLTIASWPTEFISQLKGATWQHNPRVRIAGQPTDSAKVGWVVQLANKPDSTQDCKLQTPKLISLLLE